MRLVRSWMAAATAALVLSAVPVAIAQHADRAVEGGGIMVPGWQGKVDARAAKEGKTIKDTKLEKQGDALRFTMGPAAVYWNPENTASGAFTVSATFTEDKMAAGHPHPYGIFIGGKDLDSDAQSLMYCVAYGDGSFLVRQFNGTNVTTLAKRQPHEAVKKAAEDGSVTNEVAWTVTADTAECAINGLAVATFKKSEITGEGKLPSTDGIYGLRIGDSVDVSVKGFGKK
jgi:hypothetical protein